MPDNNSYDDIFKDLVKMMENLIKEMPGNPSHRIIGYTIISGPGDAPRVIRTMEKSPCELPYELVESPTHFFITAQLPPDLTTAPYVDIDKTRVTLHVEGRETAIELSGPIDVKHSTYQVHHGLLDIVCQKA
ncbi:MAG: hypothetical protein LUQ17_02980 [Methanomicrobiales archaeon]|nr:hypothetical protein [Methanomicrobiales archaeon]